jgi:Methyltransferase domain
MFHCLEHTREPDEELEGAMGVLVPGGHLLIEVPDPTSWFGRLLGRYWSGWFQPQHQHLFPLENLVATLEEHGFDVLSSERNAIGFSADFLSAIGMLANQIAPGANVPWIPEPSFALRLARQSLRVLLAPALPVAVLADCLSLALPGRLRSTAYRIVARKPPGSAGSTRQPDRTTTSSHNGPIVV